MSEIYFGLYVLEDTSWENVPKISVLCHDPWLFVAHSAHLHKAVSMCLWERIKEIILLKFAHANN